MFIILEGTDGCGKQTQCKMLKKRFEADGYNVRAISFPNYDSPGAAFVKAYLNGDFGTDPNSVSPYLASLFYAIDRALSLQSWIDDVKSSDTIVISDRYIGSNAIYQGSKFADEASRNIYFDWLVDTEIDKLGLPTPDITFFLDMPVENSLKLMKNRQLKAGTSIDIHESNVQFLKDSRKTGLLAAEHYAWDVVRCIDARGNLVSRKNLSDTIYDMINLKIGLKGAVA